MSRHQHGNVRGLLLNRVRQHVSTSPATTNMATLLSYASQMHWGTKCADRSPHTSRESLGTHLASWFSYVDTTHRACYITYLLRCLVIQLTVRISGSSNSFMYERFCLTACVFGCFCQTCGITTTVHQWVCTCEVHCRHTQQKVHVQETAPKYGVFGYP